MYLSWQTASGEAGLACLEAGYDGIQSSLLYATVALRAQPGAASVTDQAIELS